MWDLEALKDRKKLKTFLGLAIYFPAYIPYFSWMANPLFKNLRQKEGPFEWTDEHQKCFELIKLALVSAPVRGHPKAGQTYRLYTNASDYAIAGVLQQIQYIAIKDLQGTRIYKRMQEAYNKKEPVPETNTRLSKEYDDRHPIPEWSPNWEETQVPVEHVVVYWSHVLLPAETRYSAMEHEALAAKESLVCFQPFIEGERVLLVTDHATLAWAKMYENANRRLATWGLMFAAFPDMVIIHRPGRVHSNVDPLSRLPRIPTFISPARDDLPDPTLTTEHDELQKAWHVFIKERELAVGAYMVVTHLGRRCKKGKDKALPSEESPARAEPSAMKEHSLHIHADAETIQCFAKGYKSDRGFTSILNCTLNKPPDERKFRAYWIADNGLLYFEDADARVHLCVPSTEREALLKEVHDSAHESAHTGWERTLAMLQDRFYWPCMRMDVTEYVQMCNPCQKIKHDHSARSSYLQPLAILSSPFDTITLNLITGVGSRISQYTTIPTQLGSIQYI